MDGAYWWKRNKNRKRLSASKYFSNVGTSNLKNEEFNWWKRHDDLVWFDLIWFESMVRNNLNVKGIVEIDMGRLDVIPYDDNDCMIGCKCNKCKQWKLINKV